MSPAIEQTRRERVEQYSVDKARAALIDMKADRDRQKNRAEAAIIDLENLQVEYLVEIRRRKRAERELVKAKQPENLNGEAEEVFTHWKRHCRNDSERVVFGPKRKEKVMARLKEGYTVPELKKAIDGAQKGAYVDDKGKKHDDLELICRDEVKVDRFKDLADRETIAARPEISTDDARDLILTALWADYSDRMYEDEPMEWWSTPCPGPACHGSGHNTLRVKTSNIAPLVSCTHCEMTASKLMEAL